jgi:hypothetical protein
MSGYHRAHARHRFWAKENHHMRGHVVVRIMNTEYQYQTVAFFKGAPSG